MVAQTRSYLGWTRQPRPPTYEEIPLVRDARLQDPQVLDEIELYGELVIAASASEVPLSISGGQHSGPSAAGCC